MKAGRVKGGSIIPAVIGTGRQFRSNLAQPVFNATGMTRSLKGGSARKIIEITSDDLVQNGGQYKLMGGPAIPMQIVTGRAQKGGAAQVVYPVDILGNYDPSFAGYIYKVLTADEASGYDPSSLIGFWPQNEASGGVSVDHSGHNHDGAYTAVALGQPGVPGMGMSSAGYDGATSFNNIHSASLNTAFDGAEGTILIWSQVAGAGVWTDGVERRPISIGADANNIIYIRSPVANNLYQFYYTAGGVTVSVNRGSTEIDSHPLAITWNKAANEMKAFADGAQVGATQPIAGVWAGNLRADLAVIGAISTGPGNVWSGNLAPALLYNKAKTPAEVAHLSTV